MPKRIIVHWSAGVYNPNHLDYTHYHVMITGDGLTVEGKFPISANEVCKTDSKGNALYAAHTGGGNTGSIGFAYCAMAGYKNPKNIGSYPIKPAQLEAGFLKLAQLCKQYNIPITRETLLTHYEFGKAHPKTTSSGKIDITYLPSYPEVPAADVGDFIRAKVAWYLKNKVS